MSGRRLAGAFALALAGSGCAGTFEEAPRPSVIRELTAIGGTARPLAAATSHAAPHARGPTTPCSLEWPVDAPVSSGFGLREGRAHEGIDLVVAEGTPVKAACPGVVAYAGERLRGYGRLVILRHAGGLSTVYAHNSRLWVHEGDAIVRGQVIALSGQTGRASAPHLHFEIRSGTRAQDPLKYLPLRRAVSWR